MAFAFEEMEEGGADGGKERARGGSERIKSPFLCCGYALLIPYMAKNKSFFAFLCRTIDIVRHRHKKSVIFKQNIRPRPRPRKR